MPQIKRYETIVKKYMYGNRNATIEGLKLELEKYNINANFIKSEFEKYEPLKFVHIPTEGYEMFEIFKLIKLCNNWEKDFNTSLLKAVTKNYKNISDYINTIIDKLIPVLIKSNKKSSKQYDDYKHKFMSLNLAKIQKEYSMIKYLYDDFVKDNNEYRDVDIKIEYIARFISKNYRDRKRNIPLEINVVCQSLNEKEIKAVDLEEVESVNKSEWTTTVDKRIIGGREVTITVRCNKPSPEALKNLADGLRYLYNKNNMLA